jgi:hypothetical protein
MAEADHDALGSLFAVFVRRLMLFATVDPVGVRTVVSPPKAAVVSVLAWSWIAKTAPLLRERSPRRPLSFQAMPRARKAALALSQVTTSSTVAAARFAKVPAEASTVTLAARVLSAPLGARTRMSCPWSKRTTRFAVVALRSHGPATVLKTCARAAVVSTGARLPRGPCTKSEAVRNAPSRGAQAPGGARHGSATASSMTVVWSRSMPLTRSLSARVTTGLSPATKCVPLAGRDTASCAVNSGRLRGSWVVQSWAARMEVAPPATS